MYVDQDWPYLSPSAQCCVYPPAPVPPHHAWLTPSPYQSAVSVGKRSSIDLKEQLNHRVLKRNYPWITSLHIQLYTSPLHNQFSNYHIIIIIAEIFHCLYSTKSCQEGDTLGHVHVHVHVVPSEVTVPHS